MLQHVGISNKMLYLGYLCPRFLTSFVEGFSHNVLVDIIFFDEKLRSLRVLLDLLGPR